MTDLTTVYTDDFINSSTTARLKLADHIGQVLQVAMNNIHQTRYELYQYLHANIKEIRHITYNTRTAVYKLILDKDIDMTVEIAPRT